MTYAQKLADEMQINPLLGYSNVRTTIEEAVEIAMEEQRIACVVAMTQAFHSFDEVVIGNAILHAEVKS